MKRLRHRHLVRYIKASEKKSEKLTIYMEYVAGGSLSSRVKRDGALPLPLIKRYTRQLCEVLQFLHTNRIAHRDIKCANIFVSATQQRVKLGDFGAFKEIGSVSLVGGIKGTPHWMAPEVIREQQTSEDGWLKADIWSLGCAVLEMLTGHSPWQQYSNPLTAMYQIVCSNNTPTIPADASEETTSFLQWCLQRDPADRPTAAQLLAHPFLNKESSSPTRCKSSAANEASTSSSSNSERRRKLSALAAGPSRQKLRPSNDPQASDADNDERKCSQSDSRSVSCPSKPVKGGPGAPTETKKRSVQASDIERSQSSSNSGSSKGILKVSRVPRYIHSSLFCCGGSIACIHSDSLLLYLVSQTEAARARAEPTRFLESARRTQRSLSCGYEGDRRSRAQPLGAAASAAATAAESPVRGYLHISCASAADLDGSDVLLRAQGGRLPGAWPRQAQAPTAALRSECPGTNVNSS